MTFLEKDISAIIAQSTVCNPTVVLKVVSRLLVWAKAADERSSCSSNAKLDNTILKNLIFHISSG